MAKISDDLLNIMQCPIARVPLIQVDDWLYSTDVETRRKYPIRDGIPIMLVEESEVADPEECERVMAIARQDSSDDQRTTDQDSG